LPHGATFDRCISHSLKLAYSRKVRRIRKTIRMQANRVFRAYRRQMAGGAAGSTLVVYGGADFNTSSRGHASSKHALWA
jgi:hypothetical protein